MNAPGGALIHRGRRRPTPAPIRRTAAAVAAVAAIVFAVAVGDCSSHPAVSPDPALRNTGAEAPPAVTVATGAETLPDWKRAADGTSTLTIPADLVFAKDSADLNPAAVGALAKVVAEVQDHPAGAGAHVLVEGHADSDGDARHNQELSERRAAAVASWLGAHGVRFADITAVGWGENRPAVAGIDEAAKARNRRVVITVGP